MAPYLLLLAALAQFGKQEGVVTQLHTFKAKAETTSEPNADENNEECCDRLKLAAKEAMFQHYVKGLPVRKAEKKSDLPMAIESSNELLCDFESIKSYHYLHEGLAGKLKSERYPDPFGKANAERNNWASAALTKEHSIMFAPMIPKVAHSTIVECIKAPRTYQTEKLLHKDKIELDKTMLFAVIRSPLGRFFSSFAQIESFLEGGWFDQKTWLPFWHLEWHKDFCPINYWGKDMNPEVGLSQPQFSTFEDRVKRMERYLRDVEEKGFFNWHNHPMARFFEASSRKGLRGKYNAILDMKQVVDTINSLRTKASEKTPAGAQCDNVRRAMTTESLPWSLKEKLVLKAAEADTPMGQALRRIIRRICMLYAADYRCLSVAVPDACRGLQLEKLTATTATTATTAAAAAELEAAERSSCCVRARTAARNDKAGKENGQGASDRSRHSREAQLAKIFAAWASNSSLSSSCTFGGSTTAGVDLLPAFHYLESNVARGGGGSELLPVWVQRINRHHRWNLTLPLLTSSSSSSSSSVGAGSLYAIPPLTVRDRPLVATATATATAIEAGETTTVVLQDPIERLLLSYDRLEGMLRVGSKDLQYASSNITYWKRNCITNFQMGDEDKYKKQGLIPWDTSLSTKIERLSQFVEEIENKGFFDELLVPQAWYVQTSPTLQGPNGGHAKMELSLGETDMAHFPVTERCKTQVLAFAKEKKAKCQPGGDCDAEKCKGLMRDYYREIYEQPPWMGESLVPCNCSEMDVHNVCYAFGARNFPNPWTVTLKDLSTQAGVSKRRVGALLQRICRLYAPDYQCLAPLKPPAGFFQEGADSESLCALKIEWM